jgi:hypothetical protein
MHLAYDMHSGVFVPKSQASAGGFLTLPDALKIEPLKS